MKKLLYIVSFLFVPILHGAAQKDSLLKTWNNSTLEDSARLNAIDALCSNIYLKTNPDSLLYFSNLAYDYALSTKAINYQARALRNKAHALRLLGDPTQALELLSKSITIFTQIGDQEGISSVLQLTGSIYFDQEIYKKSLAYLLRALEIREKIGNKYAIAQTYNTLGYWYDENNLFEKAIEYHYKCLSLRKEINDYQGISWCYNNIARVYFHQHNLYEAEYWYLKSITLKEQLEEYTIGETKGNLGFVYLASRRIKEAIKICEEGYTQSNEVGFDIAQQLNCECLYKAYKRNGNTEKALYYHELYISHKDSLLSIANKRALVQSELQHNYKIKEELSKIETEKRIELAEEREQKQRIISYAISFGAILLIVLLISIFRSLKNTRLQQTVINSQKAQVSLKNREITDSINYAKRIQEAILTPPSVIKSHLPDSFIFYKPKDIVAGDFYWLEKHGDFIIFAVADCTGHGVPGAMVSVVCNNALNRTVREFGIRTPGEILDKTRELVIQQFEKSKDQVKDGMDISLCVLNQKTKKIEWAGAYNPLWIVRNNEVIATRADKQPIGSHPFPTPFTTHQINVEKNDSLYLFTDGYSDQFGGERNKKFKLNTFKKLLIEISQHPMEKQVKSLNTTFENWRGQLEQLDDVCVMGFKIP